MSGLVIGTVTVGFGRQCDGLCVWMSCVECGCGDVRGTDGMREHVFCVCVVVWVCLACGVWAACVCCCGGTTA